MDNTDAVVDRLDQLILLFRVAFAEQINAFGEDLRADPVTGVILDQISGGAAASGEIKRTAAKVAGVSEKTVQRALARLVERGVVRADGKGTATTYRSTGVL